MRGNARTLAFGLALTALLSRTAPVAAAPPDDLAQAGDTALAVPRVAPAGAGAPFPQPLAPSEAARVRLIFAAQGAGDMRTAVAETARLGDTTLLPEILADRYLGHTYRASPQELAGWLRHWPDHADAPRLRSLLRRRQPHAEGPPDPADAPALAPETPVASSPEESDPVAHAISRSPSLDHAVRVDAHDGRTARALRRIAEAPGVPPLYAAALRAEVAQILFTLGHDEEALRVADAAARQGAGRIGLAGYAAGLAAWRLNRPELARARFEAAYGASLTTPAQRAGAAFWAARAHLRARDPAGYLPWMQRAAAATHTFYGLLARRTLGLGAGYAWDRETLGEADVEAVAAMPEGTRVFALLEVGQAGRAEAEMRRLWPRVDDKALQRSLLLVADSAGLTDLAAQLATLAERADGRPRDYARFVAPKLRPAGGFRLDPALVYALARLESNFDPGAVSSAGAHGLMQLMPVTAGYISGNPRLATAAHRLHDPALNLAIGQRYLLYLAGRDMVGGDLIRLIAAYNAGPASLGRWREVMPATDDPLLYMEAIPVDETRGFVPRALTYMWIYAARLHLPSPSLDQLAAGAWPRFVAWPRPEEYASRLP